MPLLLPPQVQIEDDLLNGGPCPVVRLSPHKLILSVDAVVGNFLPQPLQVNTLPL